jgi:hypothetical protein
VSASFKVLPLVPRRKLAITQDLVSNGLRLVWEPFVESAAIDEEGSFRYREVFLDEKASGGVEISIAELGKRTSRSSGALMKVG